MGISCDTFWGMSPKSMRQYQEGYNRTRERRAQEDAAIADHQSWLAGAYVTRAIAACFAKGQHYPDRPATAKEQELTPEQEAEDFKKFAARFNAKFNGGGKVGRGQGAEDVT